MMGKQTHGTCSRLVAYLLAAALAMGCANGCSPKLAAPEEKKQLALALPDAAYDQQVRNSPAYVAAKKDGWQLLVDGASAVVTVQAPDGRRWSSNPEDRLADPLAAGDPLALLCSQVHLQFTQQRDNYTSYVNSWADAVSIGQYGYYPLQDGIGVSYILGRQQKTYLFPTAISAARFEEFRSRMNEEEAMLLSFNYTYVDINELDETTKAAVVQQFPSLKETPLYLIGSATGTAVLGDYLSQQMENVFTHAGYTLEDLQKDNEDNHVEDPNQNSASVRLALEYRLEDGGLTVRLPRESLQFDSSVIGSLSLTMLPYFGSAGTGDEGYLLIPDGSGALIRLNNGKTNIPSYEKAVYGADKSITRLEAAETGTSRIGMPVYGIKQNDKAFLAVIEKGDPAASLHAEISGLTHSYNAVYPSFQLVRQDIIRDSVLNVSGSNAYQREPFSDDLQIRYIFCEPGSGYVEMARAYQDYLLDASGLCARPAVYAAYVEAVGAVDYKKKVLGIPVESQKSLTSYSQLADMAAAMKAAGINELILGYSGWSNHGLYNNLYDRVEPLRELGGASGLRTLLEGLQDQGIRLYPQVNFQTVYQDSLLDGFQVNRDSARSLSLNIAKAYRYDLAILKAVKERQAGVLSPSRYGAILSAFLDSAAEYPFNGLDIGSMSNELHSDFSEEEPMDRYRAQQSVLEQLRRLKERGYSLSAADASAYVFPYVDCIREVPLTSGGHYLFDEDIPFYQMVLHGLLPFTTPALNQSEDFQQAILRAAESGSMPYFRVMYADNTALKETDVSLYSMAFRDWKADIAAQYAALKSVLADCTDSRVIGHERSGELTIVRYDNGTAVLVNYADTPRLYNGITVEANSFLAVREEGLS